MSKRGRPLDRLQLLYKAGAHCYNFGTKTASGVDVPLGDYPRSTVVAIILTTSSVSKNRQAPVLPWPKA